MLLQCDSDTFEAKYFWKRLIVVYILDRRWQFFKAVFGMSEYAFITFQVMFGLHLWYAVSGELISDSLLV